MVVDHVVPLAAGGTSNIENLCLACYRCNEFKGPKSDALDPLSDKQVSLFKPNVQL
jgi:5-methylcytosine-specific restriction endonuclease McrA